MTKSGFDLDELERRVSRASPNDRAYERPMNWDEAATLLTEIRELRAENARLRMANRSLRRGLYGLTDSGDADEIATTLEAGGVVDWDKYPPNARAALGEPQ